MVGGNNSDLSVRLREIGLDSETFDAVLATIGVLFSISSDSVDGYTQSHTPTMTKGNFWIAESRAKFFHPMSEENLTSILIRLMDTPQAERIMNRFRKILGSHITEQHMELPIYTAYKSSTTHKQIRKKCESRAEIFWHFSNELQSLCVQKAAELKKPFDIYAEIEGKVREIRHLISLQRISHILNYSTSKVKLIPIGETNQRATYLEKAYSSNSLFTLLNDYMMLLGWHSATGLSVYDLSSKVVQMLSFDIAFPVDPRIVELKTHAHNTSSCCTDNWIVLERESQDELAEKLFQIGIDDFMEEMVSTLKEQLYDDHVGKLALLYRLHRLLENRSAYFKDLVEEEIQLIDGMVSSGILKKDGGWLSKESKWDDFLEQTVAELGEYATRHLLRCLDSWISQRITITWPIITATAEDVTQLETNLDAKLVESKLDELAVEKRKRQLISKSESDINQLPVTELIRMGENERIEFKSTLRWDIEEARINKDLEYAAVRTLAGFMNTQGGVLLIGVEDNGDLRGLQEDFKTLGKKNCDGFELHIRQVIERLLGKVKEALVVVRFEEAEENDICITYALASDEPIFLTRRNGNKEFPVRLGNSTKSLDVEETTEYIGKRWSR